MRRVVQRKRGKGVNNAVATVKDGGDMEAVRVLAQEIGPRPAGGNGEHSAAEYLVRRIAELDLPARIEPFVFKAWRTDGPASIRISRPGHTERLSGIPLPYTLGTAKQGVKGALTWEGMWPVIPGRLICPRFRIDASTGEPLAVLLASPFGAARPLPNPQPLLAIPTVVVSSDAGTRLRELTDLPGRAPSAQIICGEIHEELARSGNVIAEVGAIRDTIALVAHYDCVEASPGANDNASGVAVLLRLLERFHRHHTGNDGLGLRFIFVGAEEPFLVGSRAYVAAAATRGELSRIVGCLNFDMLGVGDRFAVRRVPGSLWQRAADELPPFSAGGLCISQTELSASSDHWAFHEAGVPSAQLTREPDDDWHSPYDQIARFSASDLADAEEVAARTVDAALGLGRPPSARRSEQTSS
jgi:aminopeptidase YwaD